MRGGFPETPRDQRDANGPQDVHAKRHGNAARRQENDARRVFDVQNPVQDRGQRKRGDGVDARAFGNDFVAKPAVRRSNPHPLAHNPYPQPVEDVGGAKRAKQG